MYAEAGVLPPCSCPPPLPPLTPTVIARPELIACGVSVKNVENVKQKVYFNQRLISRQCDDDHVVPARGLTRRN